MSLIGHGLVRLPKLAEFSTWMVGFMEASWLPASLVRLFGYAVPLIEITTGLLLLVGLYTRQSLYVALLLMAVFIFGNCTIENWEAISVQLMHALYLSVVLYLISYDRFSIDAYLQSKLK